MAKYSDIKGFTVQTVSSDPVASAAAGGAWASGGSLPTAKWIGNSAGTQTSNLFAGGATDAPATPNITAASFEYNGTSWTAGGDMVESRIAGSGFGSSNTAAVVAAGNEPTLSAKTETYNGTAFTEETDCNQARGEKLGGAGTSTAGVIFGGANPPGTQRNETETWNGSSWTETGNLNAARSQLAGAGAAYTASIAFGGYTTTGTGSTETFNGTSWTETGALNTAREGLGGSGTSTSALAFSGLTPPGAKVGVTENFDGSTWTEVADLSTTRYQVGGSPSGTNELALAAGGLVSEAVTTTEEWTAPSTFTKQIEGQLFFNSTANAFKETITDVPGATWASGPAINTARFQAGGAGATRGASYIIGGAVPGSTPNISALHEQFDGTSWSEASDLGTAKYGVATIGTPASALTAGGYDGAYEDDVELWNGSSWTAGTAINSTRGYSAGSGTTAAGLITGGNSPNDKTETYNGSSWTEVNDLNTGRRQMGQAQSGTTTATIVSGGTDYVTNVEQWDGTSWTETTEINTGRDAQWGFGTSTSQVIAGGNLGPPGRTAKTEVWNGSTWTEVNDLGTASVANCCAGGGTSSSGIIAGQYTGSLTTNSEQWTASLGNKTITST